MQEEQPNYVQTSIVVVMTNSRDDVDRCLGSLETYSANAEIIVVDNLSTDGTLEYVRARFPRVRAVSAGRNDGYGVSVNIGARIARGEYLVVLNPDTEVQAGWLSPLVEALNNYPGVGMVTPTILLMGSDDKVNACGNEAHLTGMAFCAALNEPAPPLHAPARPVAAISGAAFAVRKSLWERLGGFDERFFIYLEDTDVSWRVHRLGYTILHVPASRIRHRFTVRVSSGKLYHLERNRLLMLHKNLAPITLLALSPALALTEALVWLFCMHRGHSYLQAKWRAYRGFWRDRHAATQPVASLPQLPRADRALLLSLSPRLSMEHLQSGRTTAVVNTALTSFYSLCRAAALTMLPKRA